MSLRDKVQRLKESLARLRGPELHPARGFWTPDLEGDGPGYLIGSADDPRVKAGIEPLCWPEEDTP
jgi:hypothetical protein